MSQYRFEIHWPSSRKNSSGAVAKAAYINREKYRDERTGSLTTDYSRNHEEELLWADVFVDPKANAPEWVHDPQQLWNRASQAEKRRDGLECQDAIGNLPHELSLERNKRWVTDFIREEFTRGTGRVVNVAFHNPSEQSDDRNVHCHMMWTMRPIGPNGFENEKFPALLPTDVERLRERWAHHGARALERAAREQNRSELLIEAERWKVGHMTLDRQREEAIKRKDFDFAKSLDREPQIHMGPAATAMEREGVATRKGAKNHEINEQNRQRYLGVHRRLPDDPMPRTHDEWESRLEDLEKHRPKFPEAPHWVRGEALQVWDAYHASKSAAHFRELLAKQGFTLARVTEEDAMASRTFNAMAKRHESDKYSPTGERPGRYSPILKEGEYVVVSKERGHVHRLHELSVGFDRKQIKAFMAPLDKTFVNSLRAELAFVEQRRIKGIDPSPDGRLGRKNSGRNGALPARATRNLAKTLEFVASGLEAVLAPKLTPAQKATGMRTQMEREHAGVEAEAERRRQAEFSRDR